MSGVSRHTQGPWIAKHICGSNFAVQEFDIRSAGAYPIFQKDTSAIDGKTVYCSPEDAALIAAAPELLWWLKELQARIAYWRRPDVNADFKDKSLEEAMALTSSLIAKAKGGAA